MLLDEIQTMAYPRRYVEHIITGLEYPINQHLIKLIAFEFSPEIRRHFKRELDEWLDKIQRLRLKPSRRTASTKFYFNLLFDYPFGGTEVNNTRSMIAVIARNYPGERPTRSPEEVAEWLQAFHTRLAQRLHAGEDVLDMIPD